MRSCHILHRVMQINRYLLYNIMNEKIIFFKLNLHHTITCYTEEREEEKGKKNYNINKNIY